MSRECTGAERPRILRIGLVVALGLALSGGATVADDDNREITLQVRPVSQETMVWCWLAVSEMIVRYYNDGQSYRQCRLLELGYQVSPGICCFDPQRCARPGALQEIQAIVEYIGHRSSKLTGPPPGPQAIYDALDHDRLIVAALDMGGGAGHVVIVRGIRIEEKDGTRVTMLLVNDPMSVVPTKVEYQRLKRYWRQTVVVSAS